MWPSHEGTPPWGRTKDRNTSRRPPIQHWGHRTRVHTKSGQRTRAQGRGAGTEGGGRNHTRIARTSAVGSEQVHRSRPPRVVEDTGSMPPLPPPLPALGNTSRPGAGASIRGSTAESPADFGPEACFSRYMGRSACHEGVLYQRGYGTVITAQQRRHNRNSTTARVPPLRYDSDGTTVTV